MLCIAIRDRINRVLHVWRHITAKNVWNQSIYSRYCRIQSGLTAVPWAKYNTKGISAWGFSYQMGEGFRQKVTLPYRFAYGLSALCLLSAAIHAACTDRPAAPANRYPTACKRSRTCRLVMSGLPCRRCTMASARGRSTNLASPFCGWGPGFTATLGPSSSSGPQERTSWMMLKRRWVSLMASSIRFLSASSRWRQRISVTCMTVRSGPTISRCCCIRYPHRDPLGILSVSNVLAAPLYCQ